jgi:hypothetical protein
MEFISYFPLPSQGKRDLVASVSFVNIGGITMGYSLTAK